MERWLGVLGAVFGFAGVALGAFGAHGLRGRLEPRMLEVFETAVRYQLVHAVLLVALSLGWDKLSKPAASVAGACFVGGIVVFSGTLYALVASGVRWLGAVTPLGGTALIVGWLALALAIWRGR
jgi:uncharacterized membrane protein YgdD (TMEM256/DUF423 family)